MHKKIIHKYFDKTNNSKWKIKRLYIFQESLDLQMFLKEITNTCYYYVFKRIYDFQITNI